MIILNLSFNCTPRVPYAFTLNTTVSADLFQTQITRALLIPSYSLLTRPALHPYTPLVPHSSCADTGSHMFSLAQPHT